MAEYDIVSQLDILREAFRDPEIEVLEPPQSYQVTNVLSSQNAMNLYASGNKIYLHKRFTADDPNALWDEASKVRAMNELRILKHFVEHPPVEFLVPVLHPLQPDTPEEHGLLLEYISRFTSFREVIGSVSERASSEGVRTEAVQQIINTMADMHSEGIIHGDFHLGNVGFTQSSEVADNFIPAIIDFEYASVFDPTDISNFTRRQIEFDVLNIIGEILTPFMGKHGSLETGHEHLRDELLSLIKEIYSSKLPSLQFSQML